MLKHKLGNGTSRGSKYKCIDQRRSPPKKQKPTATTPKATSIKKDLIFNPQISQELDSFSLSFL